jgi:hypothetical protein
MDGPELIGVNIRRLAQANGWPIDDKKRPAPDIPVRGAVVSEQRQDSVMRTSLMATLASRTSAVGVPNMT